jgi:hypothetical protein
MHQWDVSIFLFHLGNEITEAMLAQTPELDDWMTANANVPPISFRHLYIVRGVLFPFVCAHRLYSRVLNKNAKLS